jgi:hypothetical protein
MTARRLIYSRVLAGSAVFVVLLGCLVFVSAAGASSAWWRADSLSMPATLAPASSGSLFVTAVNLGDAEVNGATATVRLRDVLPAGLTATSVSGSTGGVPGFITEQLRGKVSCEVVSGAVVECTFAGSLPPYEQLEVEIGVEVQAGAKTGAVNEVSVSGGGARGTSLRRQVVVGGAGTQFGVASYEAAAFNENGSLDTQAGSHPYGFTTTFDLNRTAGPPFVPELAKDLRFSLPPGLVGDPTAFPQCSDAQFQRERPGRINDCPSDTALGVASVTVYEPRYLSSESRPFVSFLVPLVNLKPLPGEPARFGFDVLTAHVILDTAVRTGGDYGVTVSTTNISQIASFMGAQVTFWGTPASPIHDQSRGWECIAGGSWSIFDENLTPCQPQGKSGAAPFLTLPTSCTGPLQSTVQADSWAHRTPLPPLPTTDPMQALDGCNRLPFTSEVRVTPDGHAASTPSGLTADVHVPQTAALNPEGLAASSVRGITVALPPGVAVNPGSADGLEVCSRAQVALSENTEVSCPGASKVAKVTIHSPLLPNPLTGFVYLAAPQNFMGSPLENPFGSLLALYIVARDPVSGVLVKLPARVSLDESTGQLTTTIEESPQLPFEDAELEFFGGARAPLASPARCGSYTTTASFAPWSGAEPVSSQSHFDITSGVNGTPCPGAALAFAPSLASGSTNINAGAFSPLTTTLGREDGQQNIQSVVLHYPPGMSGILNGVPLCPEAQANTGTCSPASQIGETIVSVGLGGDPFTVTGGKVYLTEHYAGAPFGLSIVNPAKAGPFNLQEGRPVVVRARINIDPTTAALTITTDASGRHAIPTIIEGFPLQIKHVNVLVNRPGFTFNPTNCNPQSITGTINSAEGASSAVSVPFQMTNCAALKFAPKFSVSTTAKTSKAKGASLTAKVEEPPGAMGTQANITKVKVDLPIQLPSQLKTLQKACLAKVFESNPAGCPPESIVGHAKVITPLLPVPLTGPAYFVSHGGEEFPSLTMVLQGYGVTVELVGSTFISKKGITSSTFKTVPDVPFNTFELTLPQGRYAALAAHLPANAHGSLCGQKLKMPTLLVAQNGLEIHQQTPIAVTGCAKHKNAKKAKRARHARRSARNRH